MKNEKQRNEKVVTGFKDCKGSKTKIPVTGNPAIGNNLPTA
jgi:hypothetical protein